MPLVDTSRPDKRRLSIESNAPAAPSFRSARSTALTTMPATWRRIVGLSCLATTICLWTASNFLASTIFADDTYSKPYFVTYINTSFFALPLVPMLARELYLRPDGVKRWVSNWRTALHKDYAPLKEDDDETALTGPDTFLHRREIIPHSPSQEMLLGEPLDSRQMFGARSVASLQGADAPLSLAETARLSLEFCALWFVANYFASACLQYTTVASATILNSTCSAFTLIFGTIFRVEKFTVLKMVGVLASLAGIALISTIDLSGQNSDEEHRGDFPEKSASEIAAGDAMAILAALLYGVYSVLMKRRIADESRVNMQLFFGLVGVFNVLILWPGFFLLHFAGMERMQLPPTARVTMIILVNAVASLISDIAWAYAVLLTSPLVVTVGLSITIPLSLIGQNLLHNQTAGFWYWIGALIVLLSFVLVNREEKKEDARSSPDDAGTEGH